MKRFKMNRKRSKRSFSRTAGRTHRRNMQNSSGFVMRGGTRL